MDFTDIGIRMNKMYLWWQYIVQVSNKDSRKYDDIEKYKLFSYFNLAVRSEGRIEILFLLTRLLYLPNKFILLLIRRAIFF